MMSFILDRDGVINVKAPEGDYIKNISEFHFLPKAKEAIKSLSLLGQVFVLTNQRGVSKNIMSEEDVNKINDYMCKQISSNRSIIKSVVFCPHREGCPCRKPNIGMFQMLDSQYKISKDELIVIGDSWRDIEFGININAKNIYYIGVDEKIIFTYKNNITKHFRSLYKCALWLLKQ